MLSAVVSQTGALGVAQLAGSKLTGRTDSCESPLPFYLYAMFPYPAIHVFPQATLWFAQAYYSKPAEDSDILAVARLTSFIKQASGPKCGP